MDTFIEARNQKVDIEALEGAIKRSQDYLLRIQSPEGYWVGELEADASVTAGYIPLMYFMQGVVDPGRQRKVVNYVLSKQQADGAWSAYYGGPGDLNVTIQAYFALKLAGISSEELFMQRARQFILSRGGITQASVFTKIWLALFGQFEWKGVPALPPEIILLPNWFYFNIYEFASWSRETIVALMIVLAKRPICSVPESAQLSDLYLEPKGYRGYSIGKGKKVFGWRFSFRFLDLLFKTWQSLPSKPGRGLALRRAEKWLLDHQEADGSWGGIMLPWVYALMALKSLGYPLDYPAIARGMRGLEGFVVEDASTLRLQPATSPVWDTAWVAIALSASGLPADHPSLDKTARWLLRQEVRQGGDWQVKNPKTAPGGWAFEFDNDYYPDIDDTAVVCRALRRVRLQDESAKAQAIVRGERWLVSMQSRDGGWAAFDKDNNHRLLADIPFADFMTPLDPTSPDVTAHALELLAEVDRDSPALRKSLGYLRKAQTADGTWYGRWGVSHIYGTGLVLASLCAAGEDMRQSYVQKTVSWLNSHQNQDGGWGETCYSYENPNYRGIGASTASQTAWALIGLIASGEVASPDVTRAVNYLLETQQKDGTWQEAAYTGTGFPKAFYLRYDLYRIYFPLMVLAQYRASLVVGIK